MLPKLARIGTLVGVIVVFTLNVVEAKTIRISSIGIFAEAARKLSPAFEKQYPGVKVVVDEAPWETLHEKQVMELAAGTGVYDVVCWCGIGMKEYIDAGWVYALNDFIDNPKLPDPDLQDYPKAAFDPYTDKGTVYGIAHSAEAFLLFYNGEMLANAGMAPPDTFDELYAKARGLTIDIDGDGKIDQYGFGCPAATGEHACSNWSTFLWSYGGEYFNSKWEPIFNSEEGIAALEFFSKLLQQTAPPGVGAWGNEETTNLFAQGKIAMMQMWAGLAAVVRDPKTSRIVGKDRYGRMPAGPKAQIARFGAWGQSVTTASKNKEEAYKWLVFYNNAENTKNVLMPTGIAICRKSIMSLPEVLQERPDFLPQIAALETAKERPGLPEIWEIIEVVGRAVNSAVVGTEKPKVLLDRAVSETYSILEKAGYYK